MIAGPTGSGKAVFVRQFLQNLLEMDLLEINCYGKWQPMFQEMIIEGFPDMEKWQGDRRRLVIIDDLMSETDDRLRRSLPKVTTIII